MRIYDASLARHGINECTVFLRSSDTDVKSKLKREAQPLKSYISATAIRYYLAACEQKRMAIVVAIKRADQGALISSDAMGAWADSWGAMKAF